MVRLTLRSSGLKGVEVDGEVQTRAAANAETWLWMGAEIKGLDGERKALVYDNYSKLITATDTIRKVGGCFPFADRFPVSQNTDPALCVRADAIEYGPSHPHNLDARPRHHAHRRNGNRLVGFAARPHGESSVWPTGAGRKRRQSEAARNCPVGPADAHANASPA